MSKTVEERIVEMRFDNKQFESGVKQTRQSIAQLNEDLQFKNATKGIQNVQSAFDSLNMTAVLRGFDNFKVKLSGIEVFGKRIIENLADSLYGGIQKVNNGISGVFRQISEGGATRAQNIEQAKFQLEGLGIAWEDIKGDIDYAVSGTAYGLDVAARAASQLVASNVQLGEEMKFSLRGISGLAAMTNSSYEDIASIFTKVAGQGRMMGEDLNRIAARGINAAAELAKAFGVTESEIRDMVSKGKIDFKTFAKAMDDAFGEHAKDANKTYAGSLSNVKAALSRIGADIKAAHFETLRQVFVDLIPKLNEFKKAFKPVEDLIISVESALGKLIQNFIAMVDVTKLVKKISKPIEKIGNKILDVITVINGALEKMQEPAKVLKEFAYVSREAAMQMSGFGDAVKYASKEEEKATEYSEDMQKALQAAKDIWMSGKYGNGQARMDALEAAGIDSKKTQAIIEAFIQNGYDWDAAVKKVSEDTGDAVDENSEKAEKLKKKIETLSKIFRNIKQVIKNVATSIGNIISALFKSITHTTTDLGVGDILIKVTGAIAKLSDKFVITKERAEMIVTPIKGILTILKKLVKGALTVVKVLGTILVSAGKVLATIVQTIKESEIFQTFISKITKGLKTLGKNIKEFITTVRNSDALKKFANLLKTVGSVIIGIAGVAITKIIDGINWALPKILGFIDKVAKFFSGLFSNFSDVGTKIKDFFTKIIDSIKTGHFLEDLLNKFNFFGSSANQEKAGESIFDKAITFIKNAIDKATEKLKDVNLKDLFFVAKELLSIGALFEIMQFVKVFEQGLPDFFRSINGILNSVSRVINSTANVNDSIAKLNRAKAFAQIAKVFLAFAASVAIVAFAAKQISMYISQGDLQKETFDHVVDRFLELMGKIAGTIIAIIAVTKIADVLVSFSTSKNKFKIPILFQFASFIFAIGYMIKSVVDSMTTLIGVNKYSFEKGLKRVAIVLGVIGGFFAILTGVVGLIQRKVGGANDATKGLWAMSAVLISMALSIDALMFALFFTTHFVYGYGEDTVKSAAKILVGFIFSIMGALSILLFAMGFFSSSMPDQDMTKMFVSLGALFIMIATAMLMITLAMNDLTISMALFPDETKFVVISTAITVFSMILALSSLIGKIGEKLTPKQIKAVRSIITSLTLMLLAISFIADTVDDEWEYFGILGMLSGITLIIVALSRLMGVLSRRGATLDPKVIDAVSVMFMALGLMTLPLALFKDKNEWDAASIAVTVGGLAGIVAVMVNLMKAIGRDKPDEKAIKALALAFASLGVIIVPLIFFSKEANLWDTLSITAAMAGLVGIVAVFIPLMKQIGTAKPDPKAIGLLAVAFAGLATILVPLIFLKGENVGAIAVAMGGLLLIALAFAGIMKVISTITSWDRIAAAGGAMLAMSIGLAILGAVLAGFSSSVDTEGIIALTVALVTLMGVLTALGVVVGKIPEAEVAIVIITAAIAGLALTVYLLFRGMNNLMQEFPNFIENVRKFAYTLGEIPKLIKEGLVGGSYEAVDAHSPSKEFYKIGYYCIEGLFLGIRDTLVGMVRKLVDVLQTYIVDPICDFFGINSPSLLMMKLGDFLGEGLLNGFGDTIKSKISGNPIFSLIKNKVSDSLPDITNLGGSIGNSLFSGITDKFSSLSLDSSSFDMSQFKMDGIGEVIKANAEDQLRGLDLTHLYYLEDLLDDPNKYTLLKNAGETELTAAYERMKEHEDFLAKYPTFDDWFNDKANLSDEFWELYYAADEEHQKVMQDSVRQNYIDLSKLDDTAYKYTRKYAEYQERVLNPQLPQNLAQYVQDLRKASGLDNEFIGPVKKDVIVQVKTEDEDGNVLPFINDPSNKELKLDYDNSSVKTNMDVVSSDISSAINSQTTKLSERLTAIETKVGTFDTNQMNRTNNLINRVALLEGAIKQMRIQLDTGALVGQLVGPMDEALGLEATRKARG